MNEYAKYRLPAGALLLSGAALACETAAQAIAAAPGHPTILGALYSPFDGLQWLESLNLRCAIAPYLMHRHSPCVTPLAVIRSLDVRFAALLAGGVVPFVGLRLVEGRVKEQGSKGRVFAAVRSEEAAPPLVIELGRATGKLSALGHESGIRKGQRVRLVGDDVSQNVCILGGSGQGKSTRAINPIMKQAMEGGCGLLVLNVKGDVHFTVAELARQTGRTVRIIGIGPGAERFDLLAGVSPEMAAAYVSAMLLLSGNRAAEATFWNAGASNLSRAVLGLLWYLPTYKSGYSLPGLSNYLFRPEYRRDIDGRVSELYAALLDVLAGDPSDQRRETALREVREIDVCLREIATFFDKVETTHEIRSGIQQQLSQILAKMTVPEVEDAFASPAQPGDRQIALEQLLDGEIFVINVPLQFYGLAAAAIMTFFKLRFFTMMEQRRLTPQWNQTRRVGLIIDEAHEVIVCSQEGMSDDKALSRSRSSGTFCVFAMQSMYSLIAKVGDDAARALLANLRQRIVFRTEDSFSIDNILGLLGKTEVKRETTSITKQPGSWSASKGTSTSPQIQDIADASLIRGLKRDEALSLLSIDGESADDVLTFNPVYA